VFLEQVHCAGDGHDDDRARGVSLQELEDELTVLRAQLAAAQAVASRASSTWDRLRKERDFHRMHHQRVAQEKNKLIGDIRRIKVRRSLQRNR